MSISEEFLLKTKMVDKNLKKEGVKELVDFLTLPEIVNRMLIASDMGLPVITFIVAELEKKFDEQSNFPVVIYKDHHNATSRQNVGRVIKFVMSKYGYVPISNKLEERTRIPAIAHSKYFSTASVYAMANSIVPKFRIKIESVYMGAESEL